MTPAARIQAAIELIDRWRAGEDGMDRLLAAWGRASRFAGSGDRRAVADLVHDALRRLRSAGWVAGAAGAETAPLAIPGRAALIGGLLLDGPLLDGSGAEALAALFSGARHGPAPLTEAETARLGRALEAAPRPVRLDVPDWLAPALADVPDAALEAMRRRAPVFLRANSLRASPAEAIAALAAEGIEAVPGPLSPSCLEVRAGARRVAASSTFADGLVELQDAASQAVADYAAPDPGQTVLDFCAGAGGKTLALAALMRGEGMLHAHDSAPARLARLTPRAARAGARVTLHGPGLHDPDELAALAGACDLVLVDAPCSGSGTWARDPEAKWRLTPELLAARTEAQDRILAEAAAAIRPGGRLVYATCSLLGAENEDRIAAFLAARPGFCPGRPPLRLTPADGGDGFFAAELRRMA